MGLSKYSKELSQADMARVLDPAFSLINDDIQAQFIVTKVTSIADLPEPVGDVITLESGVYYQPVGLVDLEGNRLVSNGGDQLVGFSSKDGFTTANAGATLTLNNAGISELEYIRFVNTTGPALAYDGLGTGILLATRLAIQGEAPSLFQNSTHVKFLQCWALMCAHGLAFDGTMSNLIMFASMFGPFTDATAIGVDLRSSAVITHANILQCGWYVNGTQIGARQDALASVQEAKLSYNRFNGTGTFVSGFDKTTPDWIFTGNSGVLDSRALAGANWSDTTPVTFTPSGMGAYANVPGAFSISAIERFTETAPGVFRYDGIDPVEVSITGEVSVRATSGSDDIGLGIALNGTVIPSTVMDAQVLVGAAGGVVISSSHILAISNGQTLSLQMANLSSTDGVRVYSAQLTIFD